MNIIYSCSDSYAELAGISIVSLFENNSDIPNITIFIIDNNISSANKTKLLNTAQKYNRKLVFLPKIDLKQITGVDIYTGRWNIGTYFRLFVARLLPKDVDKVIYLDCDILIRHSLGDVYDTNIENYYVAGVDDCRSDLYRIDIGCKPESIYINNGFLLINVEKWRKDNIENEFIDFINDRNGDCTYMDQAPLNSVLNQKNGIFELDPVYNAQRIFFDFSYKQVLKIRKPVHCLSYEQYVEATDNPIVVHFTPVFISGTRPWQTKDKHKFTKEWRYYKSISEWKDVPYRKDDRKLRKKIMTIICKILPKFIMIPIISYLHSKWYPKKRIRMYNKNKKKHENTVGK